ncbi:ABC transporter substrate-binding protein [Periweissella ghanensis]|uniref:Spermidine/putrescine-binding periplasmic protein n=1 Tax=Periweissella ghanensis TaxID=467997 RepID=A0ABN8BJ06_9LACO|nr:spermidine/putrescine ABC transporter substrate-binding protein [Periweissella ghanensis]MCM0600872.1 spermidine/putrescine ABC transporter substrate-binding protein [Periweissella ghanensis]CAH0417711.1 Spermidine/putrescine-binding periplasmic protein [Periweissella ghanensis]
MKKIVPFVSMMIVVLVVLVLGQNWLAQINKPPIKAANTNQVLNIYNWGDYIDPALLAKFTKETGYQVNYDTFDSNQALETKVKQGGTHYDVIFPSEYLVSKMTQEGLLAKLDYSKIHGFDNLSKHLLNQKYDPHNEHSLPYFWGTTGIMYNDQVFHASQLDSWGKLWNPIFKDQLLLIDGPREMLQPAMQALGYSLNTENQAEIKQIFNKFVALGPNIRGIVTDEKKQLMINGDANISVTYNGDAQVVIDANPHVKFLIPKEGGPIWTDNMAIPKNANNKKAAYAFINFMLNPKNAAQNAEYVAYSSPNQAALKYLPKSITHNPVLYPPMSELKNAQHYNNQPLRYFNEYNEVYLEAKTKVSLDGGLK